MRRRAWYDAGLRRGDHGRSGRRGWESLRMPLLEEFARDFDRSIQARGREYFRRGAARITGGGNSHVEATVQGGNRYRVQVKWDETGEPTYDCSCPFFRDRGGQPCKHLWAVLLQAKQDGLLNEGDDLEREDGDEGDFGGVGDFDESDESSEEYEGEADGEGEDGGAVRVGSAPSPEGEGD